MGNLVGECLRYFKPKAQSGPVKTPIQINGSKSPSPFSVNSDSTFISKLDMSSVNLNIQGNLLTNDAIEKKHFILSNEPNNDRVYQFKPNMNYEGHSPTLQEKPLRAESKSGIKNENINLTMSMTGESLYGESLPNNISPDIEQRAGNLAPSKMTKIFDTRADIFFEDIQPKVSNNNSDNGYCMGSLVVKETANTSGSPIIFENEATGKQSSPDFPHGNMIIETTKTDEDRIKQNASNSNLLNKAVSSSEDIGNRHCECENEFLDIQAMDSEIKKIKERNESYGLVGQEPITEEKMTESMFPRMEDGYLVSSSRLTSLSGNCEKKDEFGKEASEEELEKANKGATEANDENRSMNEKINLVDIGVKSQVVEMPDKFIKKLGPEFETNNHLFNNFENPIEYDDFTVETHEENFKS